jgi:hypothetical protein
VVEELLFSAKMSKVKAKWAMRMCESPKLTLDFFQFNLYKFRGRTLILWISYVFSSTKLEKKRAEQ